MASNTQFYDLSAVRNNQDLHPFHTTIDLFILLYRSICTLYFICFVAITIIETLIKEVEAMETNIKKALILYENLKQVGTAQYFDHFTYINHHDPEIYDQFINQLLDVVCMC